MKLHGFNIHGSARMERGTLLICIFSIFSIFVQDVPHYNHAAGSQASMIIGKTLALISLRGVVSSQRVHGVFFETTLLATGSSYGKTSCPHHEGGNHLIVTIVKECAFMASTDIRHSHHITAEFYSRKGGGPLYPPRSSTHARGCFDLKWTLKTKDIDHNMIMDH